MNNKHLHRFFKMNCAGDLMNMKIFPNLKEITESVGAWVAAYNNLILPGLVNRTSDLVDVIVVGDGHTPRTAALFAMLSKWDCFSVDPVLRDKEYNIKRVYLFHVKIEEFIFYGGNTHDAIIVCVHSHAKLSESINSVRHYKNKYLINIPCCVQPDIYNKPFIEYEDEGIHSPHNKVQIYKV